MDTMNEIYMQGIRLILAFQSLGSWLVAPMSALSFLGSEQFFLFILPVLYWCVNAELGISLGIILMTSVNLNLVLKIFLHAPRPIWLSQQVKAYASEIGFGIPSGHSQSSVVMWGVLAAWGKRKWMWLAAGIIMFLTGLSRMYLGMHFPSDVIAGWVIGAVLLWSYLKYQVPMAKWFVEKKMSTQVLLAWLASLVIILTGFLARHSLGNWAVPVEWIKAAAQSRPIPSFIDPLALSSLVTSAAALFGLSLGVIILIPRGGFDTGGAAFKRILRFILGLIGVSILYAGLGTLFPHGEDALSLTLRYVRYTLVGVWVTGIAPMVFISLKLATPKQVSKTIPPG
jgi:membrane-associated phospholipid phosphatase